MSSPAAVAAGPKPEHRRRAAWLAAYVVATFLSFPQPVAGRVVDLGAVLGWVGPALLLIGISGCAPRRAAKLAFVAAAVAYAAVLHWFYVVTVVYGHAPAIVGVVAPLLSGAGVAGFVAVFAAGAAWLRERDAGSVFTVALLWLGVEYLRATLPFGGFPWAVQGYTQISNSLVLPLAAVTGVYGLSALTALGGASLAEVVTSWQRGQPVGRAARAGLAVVLAAHAIGPLLARSPAAPDAPRVRVAALQGNIAQGVKWSPEWVERTLSIYAELSRRAAAEGAELVVWPETALPGALGVEPELTARISALAVETGATLVVGGVGMELSPARDRVEAYFDSAFFVAPDGTITARYDKSHLVPFGEYVPLRALLGRFISALARGLASRDLTAGAGPAAIPVQLGRSGPAARSVNVGVPICYELLFPDLVRRFTKDGAVVLLAITNDAWYGRTGAPHQFLAMTAMRSVETGVYTVRAANTGVSAIIDARGRVLEQTAIFERDLIVADIPLRQADMQTPYARYGDALVWGAGLALIGLMARAGIRGRSAGHEPADMNRRT